MINHRFRAVSHTAFVTPKGFEPLTFALEGRCSIQLSYGAIIFYFNWSRCAILPTIRESYGAIMLISIGLVALSSRRFGRATEPFIFKTKKGMIAHPLSVGAAGFEPATSWSQTRRDDRTTLRPEFVFQVFLNNSRKIRSF